MKNIIMILTAFTFAISLTACGKNEDEKKKEAATVHFKATKQIDKNEYKSPKF